MALVEQQVRTIVQEAIERSGGFAREHPGTVTLGGAGLKIGHQRESFQRKVARGVGERQHFIEDVGEVPNQPDTTVGRVREWVIANAKEL